MKNLTINVGDYVRNKYGIAKVIDIENKNDINILKFDRDIAFMIDRKENKELYRSNYLPLTEYIDIDKINFSSNIMDLVEEYDYIKLDGWGNKKLWRVVKAPYGKLMIEDDGWNELEDFEDEKIIGIITHEQMEAMEYKIER